MPINPGMMSSKSDEWTTPLELFNKLNRSFWFTLDAAATDANALCGKYFTKKDDGLAKSWEGERVWCNPPYSQIKLWAEKFAEEVDGCGPECIVMLVPARTDTRWFRLLREAADKMVYITGRLKFGDGKGSAPFPSALAIWLGLDRL